MTAPIHSATAYPCRASPSSALRMRRSTVPLSRFRLRVMGWRAVAARAWLGKWFPCSTRGRTRTRIGGSPLVWQGVLAGRGSSASEESTQSIPPPTTHSTFRSPKGGAVSGFVMVEQVKSLDFRSRRVRRIGKAPAAVLDEAPRRPPARAGARRSPFSTPASTEFPTALDGRPGRMKARHGWSGFHVRLGGARNSVFAIALAVARLGHVRRLALLPPAQPPGGLRSRVGAAPPRCTSSSRRRAICSGVRISRRAAS